MGMDESNSAGEGRKRKERKWGNGLRRYVGGAAAGVERYEE
jgi:hypothetical protein